MPKAIQITSQNEIERPNVRLSPVVSPSKWLAVTLIAPSPRISFVETLWFAIEVNLLGAFQGSESMALSGCGCRSRLSQDWRSCHISIGSSTARLPMELQAIRANTLLQGLHGGSGTFMVLRLLLLCYVFDRQCAQLWGEWQVHDQRTK